MNSPGMHKFSIAGLGKAPFRLVGVRENVYSPAPGMEGKAGGTCAYCGTGIRYEFVIRSADDHEFTVGCDCVEKTGDAGLIRSYKTSEQYRKHQAELRAVRSAKVKSELTTILADQNVRSILANMPHPHRHDGKSSFLEYCDFMLTHAGASGRSGTLRWIKKVINQGGRP